MKKINKFIYIFCIIGIAFLSGCTRNDNNSKKMSIVSSTDFYGEMAQAVAKNDAHVTSIINKNDINPHDYEPTATIARKYAQADIIISNGAGYDSWSSKFAKQNKNAQSIDIAKLFKYKSGQNEHMWYKINAPEIIVNQIKTELIKKNPKHKKYYEKNAQEYLSKFSKLKNLQIKAKKLLKNTSYLATEPIYDNTLEGLGSRNKSIKFAQAVEEGNDPSAATIKEWQKNIDDKQVEFVVNNTQSGGRVVNQAIAYAKNKNIPIIKVTETKPKDKTYLKWQIEQLQQVIAALE